MDTARGFALFAGLPPDTIKAAAREAESLGYGSFWLNHPGPIDGIAALAHASGETRRLALGVGVVPLLTRPPESIVEGIRAADLPLDRLIVGVGSSNPGALRRVREGVAALRARLPTRLVVAALGPQMCRLAGEVADGVLLNWVTPEQARASAALARESARAADRPAPRIFAYVRVALDAADRLAREAAQYATYPAYAANFARMAARPIDTAVAAPTAAGIREGLAAWQGAVDEVVVRAITQHDTVEEILALARAAQP